MFGDFIVTDPQGNPIDSLSGQNAIFIQNINGTFSDQTASRMPDIHRWSKLMKVTDINNDNAHDLYYINIGFYSSEAINVLYVNNGNGYFRMKPVIVFLQKSQFGIMMLNLLTLIKTDLWICL